MRNSEKKCLSGYHLPFHTGSSEPQIVCQLKGPRRDYLVLAPVLDESPETQRNKMPKSCLQPCSPELRERDHSSVGKALFLVSPHLCFQLFEEFLLGTCCLQALLFCQLTRGLFYCLGTGYTAGTPYKVPPTQSNTAPPPYSPSPNPYQTAMYPIRSAYPQQNLYAQVGTHGGPLLQELPARMGWHGMRKRKESPWV